MRRRTIAAIGLAALPLAAVLALRPAAAQAPDDVTAALDRFCAALTAADAAGVQAASTPALHARLAPDLAGAAAGSFGTFTYAPSGYTILRGEHASAWVLWRQPDGVEDLVLVTLRKANGAWTVCGGPAGRSPARPLQR